MQQPSTAPPHLSRACHHHRDETSRDRNTLSPAVRRPYSRLRHGLTAGEALPPAVLEAWRVSTGTELYEALGMSEISTYISTGPGMAVKPGSPGKPQPVRKVAILAAEEDTPRELPPGEVGLLAVHRSDSGLMLGYWRRPEEEALVYRGEWFCGGDLARVDEDGYVWFHGRHDDILNPMGYRLSPLLAASASCASSPVRKAPSVVPSALTHSEGTGRRSSLARMVSADLVQTKGLGSSLCSWM